MIKVRTCHYLALICNRQRGGDSELIRRKINQRLIFLSLVSGVRFALMPVAHFNLLQTLFTTIAASPVTKTNKGVPVK